MARTLHPRSSRVSQRLIQPAAGRAKLQVPWGLLSPAAAWGALGTPDAPLADMDILRGVDGEVERGPDPCYL